MKIAHKLAALVVLALSLSACAAPTAQPDGNATLVPSSLEPVQLADRTVLKVSSVGSFEFMTAVYIADALGEFEKENIAIEYVTLPSQDAIPALALGQVDVSGIGIAATFFNAVADGADVRLVFPGPTSANGDGLWVSNAVLGKPNDNGGLVIASSQGAAWLGVVAVERYLQDIGLELADVELQKLPIADIATALELGAVDGAWLNSPAHLPFEEQGTASLVAPYQDSEVATGFAFGPRLLGQEANVGQAFIRALMRTIQTHLDAGYKSNPTTSAALAQALDLSESQIQAGNELDFVFEFDHPFMTSGQQIWIDYGDILSYPEPLSPDEYFDSRFIQSIETGQ